MHCFRLVLVCFLCLAIPLQGIASVVVAQPLCLIEGNQSSNRVDAGEAQSCCQDAATFVKTGKPCKAGQECLSSGQCSLSHHGAISALPLPSSHFPRLRLFTEAFDLVAIWRPPTLL
ncbi:MAG: hypothetical protein ACSLE5_08930 [Porticoccaceae bacterium]